MSEKQVEIKLLESKATLLTKFLGVTDTDDTENICEKYGLESEAYEIDDILYELYKELDFKIKTEETRGQIITRLIAEIERLATLINIKREHTVFVYNQGHCRILEIQVYLGGWTSLKDKSLSKDIDYDVNYKFFKYEECITELEDIIEKLNKLYKGEI